jgi:hypothetical protein
MLVRRARLAHHDRGLHVDGPYRRQRKARFSEQIGAEHIHSVSGSKIVDKIALTLVKGMDVLEFHIPAGKVPVSGKNLPYITAFSSRTNLSSPHGDHYDIGTIPLP